MGKNYLLRRNMVITILIAIIAMLMGILISMLIIKRKSVGSPRNVPEQKTVASNPVNHDNKYIQKTEIWEQKIVSAREEGRKEGHIAGYTKGKQEGHAEGRDEGLKVGKQEGYNKGIEDGFLTGIEECYRVTMPDIVAEYIRIDKSGPDKFGYRRMLKAPWIDELLSKMNYKETKEDPEKEFKGVKVMLSPYYLHDDNNKVTFKETLLLDEANNDELQKKWLELKNSYLNDIKIKLIPDKKN